LLVPQHTDSVVVFVAVEGSSPVGEHGRLKGSLKDVRGSVKLDD
jgi:hypothetical protein